MITEAQQTGPIQFIAFYFPCICVVILQ